MDISEVKVFPIQEEKLKAFVSIVFDQCFMVNDIKIIQGRDGLFISMPSRKKKNGEFKDVAHPLNNETRRMIEEKVLGEYERVLGERGERLPASPAATGGALGRPAGAAPRGHAGTADVPAIPEMLALEPAGPRESPARAAEAAGAGSGPGCAGDAAGGAATPPAAASGSSSDPSEPGSGQQASSAEKSLDEIEEMHLRDSFWTGT
jgi:stage V sporulation protein G